MQVADGLSPPANGTGALPVGGNVQGAGAPILRRMGIAAALGVI